MNQGIRLWVVLVVACVVLAVGIAVIGAEAAVIISLSRAQTQMSQNILAEREGRLAAVAHLAREKAAAATWQQEALSVRAELPDNRQSSTVETLKSRLQAMQIANDQLEARIGALQTRNTVLEQTISSLQAEKQRLLEKLNGAPAAKTP